MSVKNYVVAIVAAVLAVGLIAAPVIAACRPGEPTCGPLKPDPAGIIRLMRDAPAGNGGADAKQEVPRAEPSGYVDPYLK